jgi:RimJ/RimL family protein N-acetyltransferase
MEWWSKIQLSKTEERFIFCVDGERAGIVKLYSIDHLNKNCVLGADLHKDFRGKGFARPMWNLMLQRCFEVHDLYRVSLTTAEFNTVAINLYRSLGFQEEGRLYASLLRDGIYRDQICMFKLRDTT